MPSLIGPLGLTRTISNFDTILEEIDGMCWDFIEFTDRFPSFRTGVIYDNQPSKKPAIEYIFVEPYNSKTILKHFGLNVRPFGHAAIRYTLPTGKQVLANISKERGLKLVEFWDPKEWFYGIGVVSRLSLLYGDLINRPGCHGTRRCLFATHGGYPNRTSPWRTHSSNAWVFLSNSRSLSTTSRQV